MVKIRSEKNVHYTDAGEAESTVDEEGDVPVVFLKTVDDTRRLFKLMENDLSNVYFEDLTKALSASITKGRRQFFVFEEPLPVYD